MNSRPQHPISGWKQFWVLARFEMAWNPHLRRIPLYMGLLFFSEILCEVIDQGGKLNSILDTQITNFTVLLFPYLLLLTSNASLFSTDKKTLSGKHRWTGPPQDFLLTRAIDRHILHRVLTTLMVSLILAVPITLFFFSLKNPARLVYLYANISPQPLLSHLAGSRVVTADAGRGQTSIFIPNGQPLFLAWHLWALLTGMVGMQLLYLIDAFKRRWMKSVAIFCRNFGILVGELILAVGILALFDDTHLFLWFAANQAFFWILTIPAWFLGQYYCEFLFSRLEQ